MLREVCGWNPSVDPQTALRMINERYRQILDTRSWYGTKVRGQISVPSPYSTGTCTVTNGSTNVVGIGTGWTPALVGQQFRVNFTYQLQTVVAVNSVAQTLQLDMPFAGPTQTSGYLILEAYFACEANIKRILWAVNQMMGWPMVCNALPVEIANWADTWRNFLGWSTNIFVRPPTPSGQYQIELWPAPFQQQVFPFEAYTQPPDMQADSDSPLAFIRSDVILMGAIADALMYRPKQNTYYDPMTALAIAEKKEKQFVANIEVMAQADNDLDQRDVMWDYGQAETDAMTVGWGSIYSQNHE